MPSRRPSSGALGLQATGLRPRPARSAQPPARRRRSRRGTGRGSWWWRSAGPLQASRQRGAHGVNRQWSRRSGASPISRTLARRDLVVVGAQAHAISGAWAGGSRRAALDAHQLVIVFHASSICLTSCSNPSSFAICSDTPRGRRCARRWPSRWPRRGCRALSWVAHRRASAAR